VTIGEVLDVGTRERILKTVQPHEIDWDAIDKEVFWDELEGGGWGQ